MDTAERIPLVTAGLLMALFLAMMVYSAVRLNISIPTCVTNLRPFQQGQLIDKGNQQYEVHMVAKMWAFDPPEVRLPPGSEVDIYLSALDVIHGVYIEHTNVNLMAVPGSVNAARVRFDQQGQYNVICHEYCGTGHHFMMAKFVIAPGAATIPAPAPQLGIAGETMSRGQQLFEDKGCNACHTTDGSPGLGPTLKGVFGRRVELTDGSHRIADEHYLSEAIREPNEEIVKGYEPVMPEVPLSAEEVRALVDYLKTLS